MSGLSIFAGLTWKQYIIIAVLLGGATFTYLSLRGSAPSPYETAVAYSAPMEQLVSVTGKVQAQESVDLAFSVSGRIASVGSYVGQQVTAGQVLAQLDSGDLSAQLQQAQAQADAAQATLASLEAGTRPEDIAVAQAALEGAQASVLQAKQSVLSAARNTYAVADDVIRNKVDQFFVNPRSSSPAISFPLSDSQLQSSVAADRADMEVLLNDWQAYVSALPISTDGIDARSVSDTTIQSLLKVSIFLDSVATALTRASFTPTYTISVIQGYQTNIATARSNISAAITTVNTTDTTEVSAESSLASAKSNLALKQAPATEQDIAAQEAQVKAALASARTIQAQLEKTALRAPFPGLITRQDAKVGATATANVPLVSLSSQGAYEIEVYVPEADIAKVAVGNEARVTLDAYGDAVQFAAVVLSIHPAETILDGVSTYKVLFSFTSSPQPVKSGMTANLDIVTATRGSAIAVPARAVYQEGGKSYVKVLPFDGEVEAREVRTGIQGADGSIELTSGVKVGDRIVTYTNK